MMIDHARITFRVKLSFSLVQKKVYFRIVGSGDFHATISVPIKNVFGKILLVTDQRQFQAKNLTKPDI